MYDLRDVEVGGDRRQTLPDEVGLVGLQTVHVVHVLFRVYGHCADTHLCARPEYTYGNLS